MCDSFVNGATVSRRTRGVKSWRCLAQCLIFSFYLRGVHDGFASSTFINIIGCAIKTLTPAAQDFANQLLVGAQRPSAATLSRTKLYFDVGHMEQRRMIHQQWIKQGGNISALMDSSPQGRGYLMHQIRYMTKAAARDAANLADQMYQCPFKQI